jgi:hypothetical protein
MAKKRIVEVGKFAVNEQGAEIKAKVTFSLKMFEGDVAQEHVANFDLSVSKAKMIDLAMSTIVIDLQKRCRELETHAKVRDFTKNTLHSADIWPGKRTVSVTKDMTPEQIRAKAFADPKFRAELMAELMEMQDTIDKVQASVVNDLKAV